MKKIIIILIGILLILPAVLAEEQQILTGYEWNVIKDQQVHTIKLIDVTNDGDSCGFEIDGKMMWIDVGKEKTVNGVYIKVFDAYPVHSQLQDNDACQVFIGGTLTPAVEPQSYDQIDETENQTIEKEIDQTDINLTEQPPEVENIEKDLEVIAQEDKKPTFWEWIVGFFKAIFG